MKLSLAIDFATQHQQFKTALNQKGIDENSARQIIARLANVTSQRVFVEIFIDYGAPGPSSLDARIRLFYDIHSGSFIFHDVAIR